MHFNSPLPEERRGCEAVDGGDGFDPERNRVPAASAKSPVTGLSNGHLLSMNGAETLPGAGLQVMNSELVITSQIKYLVIPKWLLL